MTDRKVIPIKGKHKSMSSMAAECMADPRAIRGFIIYFEEDGTMHQRHFGAIERGEMNMTLRTLKTIADALRVPIKDLLEDI